MLTDILHFYLGKAIIGLFFLLPLSLIAFSTESQVQPQIEPVTQKSGKLTISVDPRLELLAVLQHLSGSEMTYADSDGYAASIDAWFSAFKKHPALSKLRALEDYGFTYDLPVSDFLRFDGVPLGIQNRDCSGYAKKMNEDRLKTASEGGSLEGFYAAVNDFVRESDFYGWFESQRQFFSETVSAADSLLCASPDMIAHIIDWYGYEHHSYNLAISPLLGGGGYGPDLVDSQRNSDLYCVTSFEKSKDPADTILHLAFMLFHELSHPYVNPLVDKYFWMVEDSSALFEPIKQKMEGQAYNSWWIAVVEHFVRGSELRLIQLYYPPEQRKFSTQSDINRGFIYMDTVYDALLEYEQARRETGIRYDEYFPQLMQKFASLTQIPQSELLELISFKGPMNSVAIGAVSLIYPDPLRVEGVDEYIKPTVDFLVDRLKASAYTDTQALEMDFSEQNIYVFGAWGTNLWLDKHLPKPPFQILPDRIIADQDYPGTGLRLAACLPNPLNPELGMAIYTAQSTTAMKSSNSFFHGPEDWYVTDSDKNILGKGFYNRKKGDWEF
ncbi:MAG: DUF4932 domain-containing protein [Candidatus Cloacimonetes bacterium]|nr:DUF4932 domain-containing protein [Candidatus Cloacimonadota bacterium]